MTSSRHCSRSPQCRLADRLLHRCGQHAPPASSPGCSGRAARGWRGSAGAQRHMRPSQKPSFAELAEAKARTPLCLRTPPPPGLRTNPVLCKSPASTVQVLTIACRFVVCSASLELVCSSLFLPFCQFFPRFCLCPQRELPVLLRYLCRQLPPGGECSAGGPEPALHELLADARWQATPASSRLPMRVG